VRSNLLAPFLTALLSRYGHTVASAARAAAIGHMPVYARLQGGRATIGTEKLATLVKAIGATADEVQTVLDLEAIDRGALPLDEQTTPAELRAARAAILAQRGAP
jgi:hypothetical protein